MSKSPCEGCEVATPNPKHCYDQNRCEEHIDLEFCDGCHLGFRWRDIPNELIRIVHEGRGEFWGAPCSEPVVYGWTCPDCGHYNEI